MASAARLRNLRRVCLNANDGAAILQTIDGGLNNISNILDQLKTLATRVGIDHLLWKPRHVEYRIHDAVG